MSDSTFYVGISKCDVPDQAADSEVWIRQTSWFPAKNPHGILTSIKNTGIPVISKLSQPCRYRISIMLEQNIFASDLYESVVPDKYHTPYKNEYQKQIIRLTL